jgi:hypothetical protein
MGDLPKNDEEVQAFNAGLQEETAEEARRGNIEAAIDILREFVETVDLSSNREGCASIPLPYARYIAAAFSKIIKDDTDAALALGIRPTRAGRPRGAKTHNDVELAAAYWLLVRRNRRPEEANRLVMKKTGADRRTIQRAAQGCSAFEDRRLIDDELLKVLVLQNPTLSGILGTD